MSDRVRVATRKGLFTVERSHGRWVFGAPAFLGDPVTIVLRDPRDGAIYAALNHGHFGVKLHRSTDDGGTWTEIAAPAYPPSDAADAPSLIQVWSLETTGDPDPGTLWAGTIPGALFRTRDHGETWTLIDSLWSRPERANWFGGGYDQPGIHSILVDPRDPRHVTVGVSCGGVWVTRDGAKSWDCRGQGLHADYMPPERREDPTIQDPHRVAQCAGQPDVMWIQHHNGVFRTVDAGERWKSIDHVKPSTFGFAVAAHPVDPLTAWFAPAIKDDCRVPVDGRVVVARTRDGGRNFELFSEGLPRENAYDLVYRHALDVDATGARLAMGSTTGSLWVSESAGESWRPVSQNLPPIYQVRFD